ncbi:MAG TPA: phosphotransferase family protein [Acidimicrobiales bacterium]|nr:phosphotransferase family protein [Acidimicrobiales bacterium]
MTAAPAAAGDVAAGLAAFLEQQWARPVVVTGAEASSAGARRANLAVDVELGGGRPVTRRLVVTIVPTAAIQLNGVDAESAVRTLARGHGVPVPEVVAFSTDPSWMGGPFFVSERVDGETVPRAVLRLVDRHGIGDLLAGQLGTAITRLHAIDPATAPSALLDLGDGAPAETALAALDAPMAGLLEPRPALSLGLRWLARNLPSAPERLSLVHTDIRTGNLIVGDDGLRAVLDWEGARRRGDPMEDVAWLALRMWRFRNDDREVGGFSTLDPFVEAYEAAGGRFDAERYRWWKVYGTLKWGLGLAAQAAAHVEGTFRSIVMAASGRRVPEMEWDLLMLIDPRRR